MIDATVAIDDSLTERYQRCLLCGRRATWMDVRAVADLALFATLCARCYTGPGWRAVDALWAARLAGVPSCVYYRNVGSLQGPRAS